jgi:hypothetical protein
MKVEVYDMGVETTDDCVSLLNLYKNAKWKRKAKFNIKPNKNDLGLSVVRTFSDGTETVSIVSDDEGTRLFFMDLYTLKETIAAIQKEAKFYITHDYAAVHLNPFDMTISFSGGDGGIIYSHEDPRTLVQKIDEEGFGDFDDDLPSFKVDGITGTEFEAEWSPEEPEWLYVANGIDIGDYYEF